MGRLPARVHQFPGLGGIAGGAAAIQDSEALRHGLNVYRGVCTCPEVAKAFGLAYSSPNTLF